MPTDPVTIQPTAAGTVAFVLLSLALLVISLVVFWRIRAQEIRLILLGLLVAVAATGYGSLMPGGVVSAAVLSRIGVILVLCGVAASLLTCRAAAATSQPTVQPTPVTQPVHQPANEAEPGNEP